MNIQNTINSVINRRKFLYASGIAVAALSVLRNFAFSGQVVSDCKVRIGVVGGRFGASFYFHEHRNCIVEAVSDLIPERREHLMKVYKCSKSYESLERLILDSTFIKNRVHTTEELAE